MPASEMSVSGWEKLRIGLWNWWLARCKDLAAAAAAAPLELRLARDWCKQDPLRRQQVPLSK